MKYDVCVFGGCSVDYMFYQDKDKNYPKVPDMMVPGGKGSNQAVASSRAGAKTTIITKIGNDEVGRNILNNFVYNNVDTSSVELVKNLENDYANIYINNSDKDNEIERFGNAIDSFDISLIKNHQDTILNSKIICCQLKCPIEVTEELIDFCYQNNKFLILTPCRPQKLQNKLDLLDKVSIITCNKDESQKLFNTNDIISCVKKYPNKLIVTLGADGLVYYDGFEIIKIPSACVEEVVDTVGAGDTLNGNLASALSQGDTLKQALKRAMYASALKIQKKTAQAGMPYKEELEKYMLEKDSPKVLARKK